VHRLLQFPDPVNEVSARLVAGGVVCLSLATVVTGSPWLLALLAYGFMARVLSGPKLSPLGQFVTRVVTPRVPFAAKSVPGPPKRFAQGIGAAFSVGACIAWFGFGNLDVTRVLVGFIVIAATLEWVFALCLGCKLFAILMRVGVIPESVCEQCADIWART
jgi:hypothetical protein